MNKLRFNTFTDVLLVFLLLGGLFLILRPFSPKQVEGAFYAVKFVEDNALRYQLFGDVFDCTPIEDLPIDVSCQTSFEGQALAVRLRYQDGSRRFLSYCAVTYGNRVVDCEPGFGYESVLPFVILEDDLGISAERFTQLRAERPLLNWSEAVWMQGLAVTAVILALLIAVWRWFRFGNEPRERRLFFTLLSSLSIGFLAYLVTYLGTNMFVSFLFDGPNAPYWLSSVFAVVGFFSVMVWRWQVYRGWQPKFARIFYSIAGGTTALTLSYFFGLFVLLALGFVD